MASSRLKRFRRLRRRYINLRGAKRPALRVYLRAKARLGRWDDRYCSFFNVSTNVSPAVKAFITRGYAKGLVPTSTVRSTWPSYHAQKNGAGQGRAADMGNREGAWARGSQRRLKRFQRAEWKRGGHTELIGPINSMTILRGSRTSLPEDAALENQHDDHVHGAY
jgi:hypothetical protein